MPVEGVPQFLGPYEIRRVLGRGGMATVYRAHDLQLRRDVALKVLAPGAPPDFRARFLREGRMGARLRHPNIVPVQAGGEAGGFAYLAEELVEGGTLDSHLDEGPLPPDRAAAILEKVARALAHAHSQGVIHRDVKPGNILLDGDGEPRLTDFGLARDLRTVGAPLSASGEIFGTPDYMSPEQASGSPVVDGRTDVWACGVVLYEALTGERPFGGGTAMAVLARVLGAEPPRIRARTPGVPPDLETIALKCLEKDPSRRYPTAVALAEDLARFLKGEPVAARRVSRLERLARRVRRNPLPWAGGGTLAAGLLAALAWIGARAWRDAAEAARLESDAAEASERGEHATAARLWERRAGLLGEGSEAGRAARELARRASGSAEAAGRRDLSRGFLQAAGAELVRYETATRALAEAARPAGEGPDRPPGGGGGAAAGLASAGEGDDDPREAAREAIAHDREAAFERAWGFLLAARDAAGSGASAEALEAARRLADLARARLREAEAGGDRTRAIRFEADLRAYGADWYAREIEGSGTLTLDTVPTGAEVEALRTEDRDGAAVEVPFRPLGATPLARVPLPMGSYLLLLRKEGFPAARWPLSVGRCEDVAAPEPVPLLPAERIGPGYAYVPPGFSVLGGDPRALNAWPRRRAWVRGFLLAEREVTVADYHGFLSALLRSGVPGETVGARAPRAAPAEGHYWVVADGRLLQRTAIPGECPILGVSWDDAREFCAWRSGVEGRRVRLPTEEEWERAARGADGRLYPWGDGFRWDRVVGARSPLQAGRPAPRAVGTAAGDLSPFGIRDLAGSAAEWCADEVPAGARAARGGAWSSVGSVSFRSAYRRAYGADLVDGALGFRVAAEAR
ncbi:MAG: SUMF1/EgtB/PvdO family nonheme iron enzyme [Planctomycetales bacterium]|nr:SUMF1/EgtB/PvdO family nonheme iron enzyme [Planctomycetales bacterium]